MTREDLARLAQKLSDGLLVPEGIRAVVIVTDETGAFIGVGANCDKSYMDALVWCAAHGEDRVDHYRIGREGKDN